MQSISKSLIINNRATLTKFEHAVAIRPGGHYGVKVVCLGNLRSNKNVDGRIKGLSPNALNRLREAIARTRHKDGSYSLYGVCLTIPWGEDGELSQADGREIWRIFNTTAARAFARLGIGAIFRVELQERKAVHWHLMVYLPEDLDEQRALKLCLRQKTPRDCFPFCTAKRRDDKGRLKSVVSTGGNKAHYYAISYLRLLWVNACNKYHNDLLMAAMPDTLLPAPGAGGGVSGVAAPSVIRSWDYCLHCFPLDGVLSGVGYLASHTAKRKQAQLGYTGKQWGYLGKKSLVSDRGVSSAAFDSLTPSQRVACFRSIRAWAKRNRPNSVWLKVRPSRLVARGGVEIFNGLSVRNYNRLYLFGVPDSVFEQAIKGAKL